MTTEFDNLGMGGTPVMAPDRPPHWCVFALLYSCVFADGQVRPEEEMELDALLTRAKSLIPIGPEEVEVLIADFKQVLGVSNHVYPLVDEALQFLPREPALVTATFIHCADMMFADRRIHDDEMDLLIYMRDKLEIGEAQFDEIWDVMEVKHAY